MATTTMQLSVAEWARNLGLPQRTLAHRLEAVPPDRLTKRSRLYALGTILPVALPDILARHDVAGAGDEMTLAEATRRHRQAAAKLAEYELAQKSGSLVPVEEAAAEIERRILPARAKLLGLPVKLAPLVAPENPDKARAVLERAIHEVLTELAAQADPDDAASAA